MIIGYYAGFVAPLLGFGTLNAIFFGVYGNIHNYLVKMRLHREGYSSFDDELQIHAPIFDSEKVIKITVIL